MFSRKQSPANTRLQRKVVPFVAVEMSFSLEKALPSTDHFRGRKDFLPVEPRLSLLPHSSLKLDVGGGFLRCFWNLNKIESKTVRAFARGVLLGEPRFA